ncbi:MAG TPA: aminopeptidase P N-terminal domain-containing protein, partial [Candidatus Angelobacter sp.]|nr:aminopeptidase P N-terminal domain-containing protein [Candidatus Angelobacter sp.]
MTRRFWLILLVFFGLAVSATERQDNADYKSRRMALARLMNGGALLLFAPTESEGPNNLYGFRQEDNFYYLTGWAEPGAAVLISSSPYSEVFFLADHNLFQEKWTGPKLGPTDPQAARVTGFARVASLDKVHDEVLKVIGQSR